MQFSHFEVQFSHFRVQLYPKLHKKACNHIYFIKCSLIFQDSYMRSGDNDHLSRSLSGHLDYVRNHTTTFVCAFNVTAV